MLIDTYVGTSLLLAAAVAHDLRTRGGVHVAYQVVVPAIAAGEVATSFIYHSPLWLPIARAIVGT